VTLLIVGATGTLGQVVYAQARRRGLSVVAAARNGAEIAIDLEDPPSVERVFTEAAPTVAINCAALTDLEACEDDPSRAMRVNSEGVAHLARASRSRGSRLVHVSTDHFFSGDGRALHGEDAGVRLVNEYARSKYSGEAMAREIPGALVIRTNFTGWRGWRDRPTFIEWATDAIGSDAEVTGFDDYITSTIDARSLADALLDLVALGSEGLLNVGSRNAVSKFEFLKRLARRLGRSEDRIVAGSVNTLRPPRAESAGLDVECAEALLKRRLPDVDEVIANLLASRDDSDRPKVERR
jgi:dTDP-4-dehydrorhamnose reductase